MRDCLRPIHSRALREGGLSRSQGEGGGGGVAGARGRGRVAGHGSEGGGRGASGRQQRAGTASWSRGEGPQLATPSGRGGHKWLPPPLPAPRSQALSRSSVGPGPTGPCWGRGRGATSGFPLGGQRRGSVGQGRSRGSQYRKPKARHKRLHHATSIGEQVRGAKEGVSTPSTQVPRHRKRNASIRSRRSVPTVILLGRLALVLL
jgi:hypothetical protein